jgi:hypothetical protein
LSFMMLQPSPHWAMWSDATSSLAPRRRYCQQRLLQNPGNRVNITALMTTQLPQACLKLRLTVSVAIIELTPGLNQLLKLANSNNESRFTKIKCLIRIGYWSNILLHQCATMNTKFSWNTIQI